MANNKVVISLAADTDDIDLPTGTPRKPEPLDEKDRNDVTDIFKMEKKFDEYVAASGAVQSMHLEWLTAYNGWSNRMDKINGAAKIIDRTLEVLLVNAPQDVPDGEKWFDRLSWIMPMVSGGGGLVAAYIKYRNAQTAIGGAANLYQAAERGALAKKAKAGIYISAAVFALGAYTAIKDGIQRANFLIGKMDEYDGWFNDSIGAITTMKDETELNILPRLYDLADALGVKEEGKPNETYRAVIAKLEGLAQSLAEYEAQYRIATRMICAGAGTFTDSQISTATGLDTQVIADRRSEAALDSTICETFG